MHADLRTRDLYFAAYVHACMPITMRDLELDGRIATFVFRGQDAGEADQLEQLRRSWINQTATVNACRYSSSVKMLKSLVHG